MLYLIDKPMAEIGLRTAADDPDAHVVLIQDGVYLTPDLDAQVSAVARDVDVRGVDLPPEIEPISYDRVVELLVEREVKSFV
ncbi:DsrH/TusB family sulfur metabolism protein [Haloarcula brevis]|uniref:DsrH/TusB family sulfur metabolism protein n=1 Tax=Haloarcula brevis TaxID=3111453 RepID=UPI00300EF6A7